MSFSILIRRPIPPIRSSLSLCTVPFQAQSSEFFSQRRKVFSPVRRRRPFSAVELSPLCSTTSDIAQTTMNSVDDASVARLTKLRSLMQQAGLSALIVPTADPHLTEFPPLRFWRRHFISNFKGSAGTAVITTDKAALWTDGRYFLQAEQQLPTDWILMKAGTPKCPEMDAWLCTELKPGSKVGVDPFCHSEMEITRLSTALAVKNINIVGTKENLIDLVRGDDTPPLPKSSISIHPIEYAGETVESKVARIREEMKKKEVSYLLVSKLDEICWILNVRGEDALYTPFVISYLLVSLDSAVFFVDKTKVSKDVAEYLIDAKVTIRPYSQILEGIKEVLSAKEDTRIWLDPNLNTHAIFLTIKEALGEEKSSKGIVNQGTPLTFFMSLKNEKELEGMKEAHIQDAVAIVEFLAWFEEQIGYGKVLNEVDVDKELTLRRSKRPGFKGVSFPTIAGANDHGAIIHYRAVEESCNKIDSNTLLLIDSGGQYDGGTTDITRTFHLGTPTQYQKTCFTKVLQGHIALATACFPYDTPGLAIDAFARRPLWSLGLDYAHGTGHGVGAHMSVHEGPISISFRYTSAMAQHPLKENMIVSNEPGYYEKGAFGIRIENLCLIKKLETPCTISELSFLGFETISFVPIQIKMMNQEELNKEETKWVNDYHKLVWEKVHDKVSQKAQEWLKQNTQPIT